MKTMYQVLLGLNSASDGVGVAMMIENVFAELYFIRIYCVRCTVGLLNYSFFWSSNNLLVLQSV